MAKILGSAKGLICAALAICSLAWGAEDPDWWRKAVIYEIYPRSFADTNGDGIGDLNGITEHLDYLKELGVDAIWITPFYPSPQVDFGYDISDYRSIDRQYGTMEDFDRLMREATKRGIKVINDMVLNHTSDQHPWFKDSQSSRSSKRADWYVWHNPDAKGNPPNNWQSIFGHSAWQWSQSRRQFYYHAFYKEQPDLNFRNRAVRDAMYDIVRFWMDKGVAGFRLDAVPSLFEDQQLRDEPYVEGVDAYGERKVSREYTDNLPEVHDVLQELRRVTNEYPGRVLLGETYLPNAFELAKMYGKNRDELQLPMDMQLGFINRLAVTEFRQKLFEAETELNGNVPLFAFDNHDNARSVDRYGDGLHDELIQKLIATVLLTPRDAALVYYGQELGMRTNTPAKVEDVRDPIGRAGWPQEKGRDGERTPMQWNNDANAGFGGTHKPWLPVGANYRAVNVAVESREPDSLLNYYKKLIKLRKENEQLRDGDFVLTDEKNIAVLSYVRTTRNGQAVVVAMNFSGSPQMMGFDLTSRGVKGHHLKTLIASFPVTPETELGRIMLPPYGAYVGQVTQ
jgi:alpha-glucosidase